MDMLNLRKKIGIISAAFFASMLLVVPAHATLILSLSDGTDTITTSDLNEDGAVLFVGGIGDWVLNITVGVAGPLIGDTNTSRLDLSSLNVMGRSRNGGTLTISLTSTGNDVPFGDTSYSTELGGTSDGSISFSSYVDNTNAAFGMGTLIYDTGPLSGSFSSSGNGGVSVSGPYSITTVATITHDNGLSLSGFNHGVQIPEPAGLALFGIGLLGLAFGIRKAAKV